MNSNIIQNSLDSWKTYKLKDLVNFLDGDRRPIKSSNRISGDYPYYGASGIVDYVHDYIFDGEYVLLGEDGENILSRNTRLVYHVKGKIWVNNHAHVLACLPHVNPIFLTEKLESLNYTNLNSGTAQPKLNKETCSNIVLTIPPLAEQQKIAQALTDADNYISALEKLIEKKKMMKEGLMVNLLTVKQRLKEFAFNEDGTAKGYKDSELGKIPEDWEIFKLKDLTYSTAGGTPSTLVDAYWGGENPWMSSGELHLKEVFDVSERITDLGLENSSTKYVPKNSVLIGLAGQGKTRGTVAISRIRLCTNQSIAAIFPSPKFNSDYLYYNLDNRYEELRSLSTGDGGRGGLNLSVINNLSVPFPNIDEQNAIVNNLKTIDNELNVLNTKLSKANLLKQGMMQKLLTGEIRLA